MLPNDDTAITVTVPDQPIGQPNPTTPAPPRKMIPKDDFWGFMALNSVLSVLLTALLASSISYFQGHSAGVTEQQMSHQREHYRMERAKFKFIKEEVNNRVSEFVECPCGKKVPL